MYASHPSVSSSTSNAPRLSASSIHGAAANSVSSIPAVSTHSTPSRRHATPAGPGAAGASDGRLSQQRPPSTSTSVSQSGDATGGAVADVDSLSDADLENLSQADLIAMVEEAELRSRVLAGLNERKVLTESKLREAFKETVERAEVEEDRLSNRMLRRADSLKHQHSSLLAHLAAEERQVKELDTKFKRMSNENTELESTLIAEEHHIVQRLKQQIAMLEHQKAEIAEKLTLELPDVAEHVERLQLAPAVIGKPPPASGPLVLPTPALQQQQQRQQVHDSEVSPQGKSRHADPMAEDSSSNASPSSRTIPLRPSLPMQQATAGAAAYDDAVSSPGSRARSVSGGATPLGGSMASTNPAAAAAGFGGGSFHSPSPSANSSVVLQTPLAPPGSANMSGVYPYGVPQAAGSGSSSPAVGGGSTSGTATSGHRNLAQDYSMTRLLQQEIDRVAALEADLGTRSTAYRERISNLESRVDRAKLEWEKQRAQADKLRVELTKTKKLTRELVANHELLVEWQAEREINATGSRNQSIASTPRHVPAVPSPGLGASTSNPMNSSRGRGGGLPMPPLSQSPQATPRGSNIAAPLGRSQSVASQGDESTYSTGVADTPLASQRSIAGSMVGMEAPTVLHGGTPMSSARRQYANGSACSNRLDMEESDQQQPQSPSP